jgi:methylenetetrahydrofolate dehydrogenase (NADP+)/methenyltetrahydrofolate cyclohydrolase/formyltetrahydrofolate synthetase
MWARIGESSRSLLSYRVLHHKYLMDLTTFRRKYTIDGRARAKEIQDSIRKSIAERRRTQPNFTPALTVVQVGDEEDAAVYIRAKNKCAEDVGIRFTHLRLPASIPEDKLLHTVEQLNADPSTHGIIVQLPLPVHINALHIIDAVQPNKDVDGFCSFNAVRVGKVGSNAPFFLHCTASGVRDLIDSTGFVYKGAHAVVVGSGSVARPCIQLLIEQGCAVTVCNSKTTNVKALCQQADLVISACRKPGMIKGDWIKPGAVVIDIGINVVADPSSVAGRRTVGDVAFAEVHFMQSSIISLLADLCFCFEVVHVAKAVTPVPGGVGPMTVVKLLENTLHVRMCIYIRACIYAYKYTKIQAALGQSRASLWTLRLRGLDLVSPPPPDAALSQSVTPLAAQAVASAIGLRQSELFLFGPHKAKVQLSALARLANDPSGSLVVVTAMTPTPHGEGKSTVCLALAAALNALSTPCVATLRQPSLGPTFGAKGGAAGGGYAQVCPMEELNLHLTGDAHAVTVAHNLVAAAVDARLLHENSQSDAQLFARLVPAQKGLVASDRARLTRLGIEFGCDADPSQLTPEQRGRLVRLGIDKEAITWRRAVDVSDRALRGVAVGQGAAEARYGIARGSGFDLTPASELMALLCLSESEHDLRVRLSRVVWGYSTAGQALTLDDLGLVGALQALLRDALQPTLMQTLEGAPVLVHTGAFANIGPGCSSVIADRLALKLVGPKGVVVTEAGFGADVGLEKFVHLKCRSSGLAPRVCVVVASVRALKHHGWPLEGLPAIAAGSRNLARHVANAQTWGLRVVVCVNRFPEDSNDELQAALVTAILS